MLSYLIIGLPDDGLKGLINRAYLAIKSKSHFLSVNIYVPRPGEHYFKNVFTHFDDSQLSEFNSSCPSDSYCKFSIGQLNLIKFIIYSLFYLSPRRIYKIIYLNYKRKALKELVVNVFYFLKLNKTKIG